MKALPKLCVVWIGVLVAGISLSCSLFYRASQTGGELAAWQSAQARWQAQKIDSYELQVADTTLWHRQTYTLTVQSGQVVSHTAGCVRTPLETTGCRVRPYRAEEYTVPALFQAAREKIGLYDPDIIVSIEYDETYGFPKKIFSDPKRITDAMHSVTVTRFKPLKP